MKSPMGNEVGLIMTGFAIVANALFPSPMGNEVGLIEFINSLLLWPFVVSVPYGE